MRFTRKSTETAVADTEEPGSRLRSELNRLELTAIGLAVMVGAGIFISAPEVFVGFAGTLTVWSFALAALLCVPVALCYAECSSRIPVAGSAYTFAYVAFGRPFAWAVGWLLSMEYAVGAAVVAKGWSGYLRDPIAGVLPPVPRPDWGAAAIVVVLALVLSAGARTTSRISLVATAAKVGALLLVVAVGSTRFDPANLALRTLDQSGRPVAVAPPALDVLLTVVSAVGILFYAFIGFDSVSTMAEEARRPRRDLPQAILGALGIATVLYLAVSLVMAAGPGEPVKPAGGLARGTTLAAVFDHSGDSIVFYLVSAGAVLGLTTGILVLMLGQSRIAFAMTRDGFLPGKLAKLGWRRNPQQIVLWTGAVSALLAAFGSSEAIQPVVNLGTLVVFAVVCGAALALRIRKAEPPPERSFRVPAVRTVAVVGIVLSVVLGCYVVLDTVRNPATVGGLVWFGVASALYAVVSVVAQVRHQRAVWRSHLPSGAPAPLPPWWPRWRHGPPSAPDPGPDDGAPPSLEALVARQRVAPIHRLSGLLAPDRRGRLRAALCPIEERPVDWSDAVRLEVVLLDPELVRLGIRCGLVDPPEVEVRKIVDDATAGRIIAVPEEVADAMVRWAEDAPSDERAGSRRRADRLRGRVLELPRDGAVDATASAALVYGLPVVGVPVEGRAAT